MTNQQQTTRPFLPYGRQLVDEEDVRAVVDILHGDLITTGPTVAEYEKAFSERVGSRFAAAVSSGTAALHISAIAAGLGEGGVAIVPGMTFLATANAPRYTKAELIFADVDGQSGLMRAQDFEEALRRADGAQVQAVFPVHLNGQCEDLAAISEIAGKHGVRVIEDACHALGTTYRNAENEFIPVGSCAHGELTIFSTHPVKTITTGEGGVITTNNPDLSRRLRNLRNHGIAKEDGPSRDRERVDGDRAGQDRPWYYEMSDLGFNYRTSDIHCALGLSQLRKLDHFAARRRALAARYDELLKPLAPVLLPVAKKAFCRAVLHLYAVLIDFGRLGTDRGEFMGRLHDDGIGTQVHYIPVYQQPYYVKRYGDQRLPGCEAYYGKCLTLPLFAGMTESDVERVAESLQTLCGKAA